MWGVLEAPLYINIFSRLQNVAGTVSLNRPVLFHPTPPNNLTKTAPCCFILLNRTTSPPGRCQQDPLQRPPTLPILLRGTRQKRNENTLTPASPKPRGAHRVHSYRRGSWPEPKLEQQQWCHGLRLSHFLLGMNHRRPANKSAHKPSSRKHRTREYDRGRMSLCQWKSLYVHVCAAGCPAKRRRSEMFYVQFTSRTTNQAQRFYGRHRKILGMVTSSTVYDENILRNIFSTDWSISRHRKIILRSSMPA